jgi:hypothetical protein
MCTVGALRAGARDVDVASRPAVHANGHENPYGVQPAKKVKVADLTGRRGLDR